MEARIVLSLLMQRFKFTPANDNVGVRACVLVKFTPANDNVGVRACVLVEDARSCVHEYVRARVHVCACLIYACHVVAQAIKAARTVQVL